MSDEKLKLRRQASIASIFALLLFVLSTVAVAPPVEAASNSYTPATLSIGGSTLLAPLMSVWQTQFNTYTGGAVSINYQAVGSTSGTNNMLSDIFSLGFSDAPMPANGLATLNAQGDVVTPANSPPVTGLAGADPIIQVVDGLAPVAIFYQIPGIPLTTHLNLTGDIITEIFLQHITTWTNPHILAINPGLTAAEITALGKYPITVVHRSDGSGTSFALTTYMGGVDGNWTAAGFKAGSTSPTNFPTSELSGKGTGGVASLVSSNNGAIGYGEVEYAIGAGLGYAAILNVAGNYVLPTPAGATAAAAADASILATNPVYTIVNAPGTASYPLSTFTYVFMWANQDLGTSGGGTWSQGLAYDAVQFLYWIVTQGQSYATNLNYAPLPASVVQLDLGLIAQINYAGAAFIPSTTTSVTCKSSSVIVGKAVSCTVKLSGGSSPTGTFIWSSTGAGTFSHALCNVPKSGKCTTSFITQGTSPSETISALYTGDLNNAPSIATSSLTATQAASKTSVSCKPSSAAEGSTITCTVTVKGYSPTGDVTWSQSSTSTPAATVTFATTTPPNTCILVAKGTSTTLASCSMTMTTGTNPGKVTITASYVGNSNNLASLKTAKLTIKA
jgi:phosphate transport system substrate-binding protein